MSYVCVSIGNIIKKAIKQVTFKKKGFKAPQPKTAKTTALCSQIPSLIFFSFFSSSVYIRHSRFLPRSLKRLYTFFRYDYS